jgi:hypothetical protein
MTPLIYLGSAEVGVSEQPREPLRRYLILWRRLGRRRFLACEQFSDERYWSEFVFSISMRPLFQPPETLRSLQGESVAVLVQVDQREGNT